MTINDKAWRIAGFFSDGVKIENRNDVVIDDHGCGYRFDGELPTLAGPNSLISDGVGVGKWVLCFGEPPFINNPIVPYMLCIFMLITLCW